MTASPLKQLIQSPRLWPAHPEKDRRVTWMELFFDLIFVAAVAQVGAALNKDYSWPGLLRYAFLFVLIWSAWSGHSLYSTRFDTDDLLQRLLTLIQCFIAAVMAANSQDALDSRSSAGFGAAYAGMRIVLVLQYLRARAVPQTRPLTTRYAIGFGVAAVLWIASALVPVPERYWLWSLAFAVDFSTPWWAFKHSARFSPDAAHFPERFGLFTIILLGEFVAAVMRGIESQEYWSVTAASAAFASMAFAFAVMWWYFDGARGQAERYVKNRRDVVLFHVWTYAHLPLFVAIGVAGVGFERLISSQGRAMLDSSGASILCSAVAVLMFALAVIGGTVESVRGKRSWAIYLWPHCLLACAVIAVGFYARQLQPVTLAVSFLLICLAQVVFSQRRTAFSLSIAQNVPRARVHAP
jgi:low temperature requirement protein LtrA